MRNNHDARQRYIPDIAITPSEKQRGIYYKNLERFDIQMMIDDEQQRLRTYARRKYPDMPDRLRFLCDYTDKQMWVMNGLLGEFHQWLPDSDKNYPKKRKRGERTKLQGAQLLEEIAVNLVRARARQLKLIGTPTFEAADLARKQIAPAFGVSAATLEDWQRGRRRRYRKKGVLQNPIIDPITG